jgi:hypothetical protein
MQINASFDFAADTPQAERNNYVNAVNTVIGYFDSLFTNDVTINVKFALGERLHSTNGTTITYERMADINTPFSGRGTSDMLLRNSNTGGLEVYDINNNAITGAAFIGTVGLDWQYSGVGNFSGVPGETDLLLRNNRTGGLEVYDINNNQITGAAFIGTVGLDWQFAGIAPIHAASASDLVLRNVNTGQFEVYDICNNQLTGAALLGQVGLDWQVGGFAVDPPTGSAGSAGDLDQAAQLVQAMAGFGDGDGTDDSSNAVAFGADPSQQPLLTTPQQA